MSFFLNDLVPEFNDYEIWDDQPGGKIIRTYEENGKTLVDVEFKHSPGEIYTYIKD